MYKDNTIYLGRLFPYHFSRNIFRLLPCQPCSLKILINIFRYKNNFWKPEKVKGKKKKRKTFRTHPLLGVCFCTEAIALREKCPYSELLWSTFSRIRTEYGEIRIQSECGKIRTRITPNTNNFYAV